jgi:hypothetical protein
MFENAQAFGAALVFAEVRGAALLGAGWGID